MKQIRLILVIALGFMLGQSANASTVVTEQFQDYATGSTRGQWNWCHWHHTGHMGDPKT